MVTDAYSPAHQFKVWTGTFWALLPHSLESIHIYSQDANKAAQAVSNIFDTIKANNKSPEAIFNNWIYGDIGPLNPKNKKP